MNYMTDCTTQMDRIGLNLLWATGGSARGCIGHKWEHLGTLSPYYRYGPYIGPRDPLRGLICSSGGAMGLVHRKGKK